MFIRDLEPQLKECYMFALYPELQLKGYRLSHNSRNTLASRSLRYHSRNTLHYRLALV